MVQALDKIALSGFAGDGWIQRCIQDHLGLLKRRQLVKVAQELEEPYIARQIRFADTPKHPQIGLQQRKEALRPILMHVPTCVFLLCVVHRVMLIAR